MQKDQAPLHRKGDSIYETIRLHIKGRGEYRRIGI